MREDEETHSLFERLKHFLSAAPQNQEELLKLLREAQARALIDTDTLGMIEAVLLFAKMRVRDIMLPKSQITCIPESATLNEVVAIVSDSGHSRFPVTGENMDEIIGILHAKDLFACQLLNQADFDLSDLLREATVVPESKRLDLLLREFRSNRNHMAVVVDEYGATSGIVTIEDIIEQIVGDIEDEFDVDEDDWIKAHGSTHCIVKGHTPLEVFNERLNAHFSDEVYDTIGGIVMAGFGCLPRRGESIILDGFEFRVISADARRVRLLDCIDRREHPDDARASSEALL